MNVPYKRFGENLILVKKFLSRKYYIKHLAKIYILEKFWSKKYVIENFEKIF